MAKDTKKELRNEVFYSIYVRNHTEEGTFQAVEKDLERIKDLGCDVIWFMPIHPIGKKNKKGSLGCPYSIQDYREVNPEYGTKEDFIHLVDKIHAMGMKCIIDVVYNHTSPDSKLSVEHPEYFYKKNGTFGNRIGEWTDVIDLDYNNKDLWDYQIETLKQWAEIVDGFRCDVASLVPVEFWQRARKECAEVKENLIWLAESVHVDFLKEVRYEGFGAWSDNELYSAFDITYDYDIWDKYKDYMEGKIPTSEYVSYLNFQDGIYPENYVKLRCLENHDQERVKSYIDDEKTLENFTAFIYFQKGTTLIYAGQEFENDHVPSLFDIDKIDRNTGADLTPLMKRLYEIHKNDIPMNGAYRLKASDETDSVQVVYKEKEKGTAGFFSLKGKSGLMETDIPDGTYENLITGKRFEIADGKISIDVMPAIMKL